MKTLDVDTLDIGTIVKVASDSWYIVDASDNSDGSVVKFWREMTVEEQVEASK